MKKRLSILIILLFILFILFYPSESVLAAANGLVLWYENILPALLPFTIFSNILIQSGYLDDIIRFFHPLLNRLLFGHPHAAYPIAAGFLFGFPLGAKTTADLYREGKLTRGEANILCAMCNNISPVFVSSYLLISSLGLHRNIWLTYLILYAPSLVAGLCLLSRQGAKSVKTAAASAPGLNFRIIDAGIMNGFETLLKLGAYIMLFSLLSQMCAHAAGSHDRLHMLVSGVAEVTNGIHVIAKSPYPLSVRYPLIIGITAFGGLSGFAQTASMIKNTDISMRFYLGFRLFQTGICALLAALATASGIL